MGSWAPCSGAIACGRASTVFGFPCQWRSRARAEGVALRNRASNGNDPEQTRKPRVSQVSRQDQNGAIASSTCWPQRGACTAESSPRPP